MLDQNPTCVDNMHGRADYLSTTRHNHMYTCKANNSYNKCANIAAAAVPEGVALRQEASSLAEAFPQTGFQIQEEVEGSRRILASVRLAVPYPCQAASPSGVASSGLVQNQVEVEPAEQARQQIGLVDMELESLGQVALCQMSWVREDEHQRSMRHFYVLEQ
jgi:hypothetical protein